VSGQLGLDLGRERPGRVEAAVNRAIRAAQTAGEITEIHAAATGLARALARGIDEAEIRHSTRGRADCSKELREVLASLGLDRASRGEIRQEAAAGDPFDELTRAMSAATGNPAPTRAGD